jgi:hypothetical protein
LKRTKISIQNVKRKKISIQHTKNTREAFTYTYSNIARLKRSNDNVS